MTAILKTAEEQAAAAGYIVRRYRASDRATVRQICAETGFLGNPIDPVFEDRELFADYLTSYYTDAEPESTFVCEIDGTVKGYLMGGRDWRRQERYDRRKLGALVARGVWRYLTRPYNAASRKYVAWIIKNGRKETPLTPKQTPHFHINLLPDARNVANTRVLIVSFLDYLSNRGEKAVYGQMVTFGARRGERMFERYGFKMLDRVEVTKYRDLYPEQVFLVTVLKDLERRTDLYGADLRKPAGPANGVQP